MCGRFALTLPPEAVRSYFGSRDQPNFPPRLDIRPTQPVAIVRLEQGERHFALVRWGFIPGFVKDEKDFPLLINARAETAFEKPSFRNAIRRRRCLFIADAFYEWHKLDEKGRRKQPYVIRRPMLGPLALGGIWESWQSPNGSELETAAILTVSANATIAAIHDRMPVILDPAGFDAWLAAETPRADIERLMRPLNDDALELVPVAKVGEEPPGLF
jgi:putative SOS response-associated peptidase YedK